MHKKHIFLRVFSKITVFACVFCTLSAWAETTACDINFTPVTGNSWQNGTPTPTNPVAIESIGTKVGNKYQISVTAQGKNLFDRATVTNGYYISATGEIVVNEASMYSDYIKVKPSTTYTISLISGSSGNAVRVHSYTSDKNWIEQLSGSITGVAGSSYSATFTTSSNVEYVRFGCRQAQIDIQIEQGSTATSYAPYGHSTTPIYLNAPLRKVGDYADVLDYKNGTITRNVGVKVLDGTESGWALYGGAAQYNGIIYNENIIANNKIGASALDILSTHFYATYESVVPLGRIRFQMTGGQGSTAGSHRLYFRRDVNETVASFKTYLAQQYANGTPVTVYYPLETPVVEQIENWSCIPPITDIQIATTKMVDDEFAAAEANLAATVQTIESVVSRTIAQTGQIQILQDTKQTRPDETCPANMKCLLVQDEDGTPHWYPIIEP